MNVLLMPFLYFPEDKIRIYSRRNFVFILHDSFSDHFLRGLDAIQKNKKPKQKNLKNAFCVNAAKQREKQHPQN